MLTTLRSLALDAAFGVPMPSQLAGRLGPPTRPGSAGYLWRRADLVTRALASPVLVSAFREQLKLPSGYGIGLDERVVELPWVLAHALPGRGLDAGASLNHAHVLHNLLPACESLTIATLEPNARHDDRYSYVLADLRELPFRNGWFDWIASVSTLEHVGMDNAVYGVSESRSSDPDEELRHVLSELRRVLKPRGTVLITVPYGQAEDHGWLRQFDRAGVEEILNELAPSEAEVTVYAYRRDGWQLSSLDAAAQACFRERPWPEPVPDLAAAARAVACLRLTA